MQLKPYQTDHRDAIIANLLPSLQKSGDSIRVFGDELDWQSFDKVSALTLGGLQALKFTASTERFSQGSLTLKGIENAQLFIDGEKQTEKNKSYELALSQGDHQFVIGCCVAGIVTSIITDEYIRIPSGIQTAGIVPEHSILIPFRVCVQGAVPDSGIVAPGGVEPQSR